MADQSSHKALVLGGGGPLGIAWEAGLLAGLADEGVLLGDAGLVLGTSAGSVVGSALSSGVAPDLMAEAQREISARSASATQSAPPDLTPLMGFFMRMPLTGEPGLDLRKEIGSYSLGAQTMPAEAFVSMLAAMGLPAQWPDAFACTAVDTETGEFRIWRKADSVPLSHAVASSCSVPGVYPPVTINGRRWMDGGMRSATNIDQAAGCERVVALAVVPNAMAAERMQPRLDHEAKAVTDAGGAIEMIVPDEPAQSVFGFNLMDGSRRVPCMEAGRAQGRREAARIRSFWS